MLPLMPKLEPLVKSATEKISDPEARGMGTHSGYHRPIELRSHGVSGVAEKAHKTLQKAAGEGGL